MYIHYQYYTLKYANSIIVMQTAVGPGNVCVCAAHSMLSE